MEEDDCETWKIDAVERENTYFETLGSRRYDEIDKTDLFQLKKKIGFATCGKPSDMPSISNYNTGYTNDQLNYIKPICDKVIEKSDYDPIRFSCTILVLYNNGDLFETPVFRVVTSNGNIFIDSQARVYQNWDLFMQNNKLPDCQFCYPKNGEYNAEGEFIVGFAFSPASSLFNKATSCLDTVGSVAAVAAAGVIAAGAFVTVAPAAMAAAGTATVCTGVYSVGRSVGTLVDRSNHEQSIGLEDQESRSSWMAIGSSVVGVSQLAALKGASKAVESGKSLGKLSTFGLHALTASSLIFSGFGFVENLYVCAIKYNDGNLTKKDVFDLSCELLFLFNAIASARATSQLVNNMNTTAAADSSSSQKKLTKTQKRNLRRRAAKRRAKGLPSTVTEESNNFSATVISANLQILLFEAIKAYAPRFQNVIYKFQAIGHDIKCWRSGEISELQLLKNLGKNLNQLYNDYKDEITEAMEKIVKFLSSAADYVLQLICKFFETASEEAKSIFCTKVINMEDQMDLLINETESDIIGLHDSLQIDSSSLSSDNTNDDESLDDDNLNPEAQKLLRSCGDMIDDPATQWSCNDLKDFEDILDGLKYVVVSEYKSKVDCYKTSLKAAKAASEDFKIDIFHKELGIKGEVSQHFYSETLKIVNSRGAIYKIKSKISEIKKRNNSSTIPVWEALTEGMFHYYGPRGAGDLKKHELMMVVSNVVECNVAEKISLTEGNYTLLEDKDVVMISINDQPSLQIVVYCGITEDNTASGIIAVVK